MVISADPRLKLMKAELKRLMVLSDKDINELSRETGININTLYYRFRNIEGMRLGELLLCLDAVGGGIEIRGE